MKNLNKIRGKREFHFDDKDLITLGVCSLLLILLTFWLGVLVGKGSQLEETAQVEENSPITFSSSEEPSTTQQNPVTSEEKPKEGPKPTVLPQSDNPKGDLKLSYYTVLQDAEQPKERPVTQPEAGSNSSSADSGSKGLKSVPAEGVPPGKPGVETSESRKSGPLPEVPVRKPEGSPKTAPGYGTNLYSVQVTSSPSREESEALRDQFREKGYDAVVTSIDLGEQGVWYRVRVGNLANRVDAERLKKELQERFATVAKDPLIVKVSQ